MRSSACAPTRPAARAASSEVHAGDCLTVVPRLVQSARDRFDLVYVDPPFNAGVKRAARRERGFRAQGAPAYDDNWGGLDGFLQMLEPRLGVIREAMSERASLWLHLDYRAVHDAKTLCDRVFGRARFRGEIIWIPGNGGRKRDAPNVTHQTILIYSKGARMLWNAGDPALREPYASTSLAMHFQNVDAQGRRYRERVIGGKAYRYYADTGRMLGSVWADCPAMRANTPLVRETTGYPTQKPESLLERIVRAASVPESRVLDPMCGSGTTLAVARRLGRRYAGVDQSALACRVARGRLAAISAG